MAYLQRKTTDNISVSLPKDLRRRVDKYARKSDVSVSFLVKEALSNYLIREELEDIQKVLGPAFRKLGIETDEDVEKFFK